MGLRDALRNNENAPIVKRQEVVPGERTSIPAIHKKKQKSIIIEILNKFSYDALRERKARSALTILMVECFDGCT